jgi:hypothetical protein
MSTQEEDVEIHVLKNRVLTISEIAHHTGLTVKRYVRIRLGSANVGNPGRSRPGM